MKPTGKAGCQLKDMQKRRRENSVTPFIGVKGMQKNLIEAQDDGKLNSSWKALLVLLSDPNLMAFF